MAEILKRGATWYYRFTDEDGRRRMVRGCKEKRETEGMAAGAEARVAKIREGLVDPKEFAYTDHERRSLADHLADWFAFLKSKGTAKHAELSRNRCQRLFDVAKLKRISDLAPSKVQAGLQAIREGDDKHAGVSLRSVHHYLRVVKGFSRWLWRDGRAKEYTLAHLSSENPDTDRRHERRALLADELARLIHAAATGPMWLSISGTDRARLYLVAAGTGFRANECRSLTPESFALDADPPTISVTAAYSKRRRDDRQPIRPELAAVLRPWLASKAPGEPVFGNLTTRTSELIQRDLKAAGIPYRDASGRVADFHALRHSYVTALAMSANPVKVVQSLARHSTPALTLGVYTHVGLYDQTTALKALPDLSRPPSEREALAATGTEGRTHRKTFAPHLIHAEDAEGRIEPDTGDHGCTDQPVPSRGSVGIWASAEKPGISASDAQGVVETHEDAGQRERMGIEPTRSRSRDPSAVLKTVPGTSRGNAPERSGRHSRASTADPRRASLSELC